MNCMWLWMIGLWTIANLELHHHGYMLLCPSQVAPPELRHWITALTFFTEYNDVTVHLFVYNVMVIVYILELRPNAFLKYCAGKNGMDGWTDNPKNIMALITAGAARIWQSEASPSLWYPAGVPGHPGGCGNGWTAGCHVEQYENTLCCPNRAIQWQEELLKCIYTDLPHQNHELCDQNQNVICW